MSEKPVVRRDGTLISRVKEPRNIREERGTRETKRNIREMTILARHFAARRNRRKCGLATEVRGGERRGQSRRRSGNRIPVSSNLVGDWWTVLIAERFSLICEVSLFSTTRRRDFRVSSERHVYDRVRNRSLSP